mmetsp:Transcript_57066/g.105499  ORF Transcript_57066/g.105499 Transcript_57066/m.105499 type:complete len:108 (-) Transcript_57066:3-326(-)
MPSSMPELKWMPSTMVESEACCAALAKACTSSRAAEMPHHAGLLAFALMAGISFTESASLRLRACPRCSLQLAFLDPGGSALVLAAGSHHIHQANIESFGALAHSLA